MLWANFLHIYQPPNQTRDILDKVANESYAPLFRGLREIGGARLVLNINAVLTEMLFEAGYVDILDDIKFLASENRLEFTESAIYHAFLPLLPSSEIKRQIELNNKINKKYFGNLYHPKGFFPPEMGYSLKVAGAVKDLGYEWMILDEISYRGKVNDCGFDKTYKIKDLGLKVYFRDRRTSNLIMGAIVRRGDSLIKSLQPVLREERFLITAMDGETFGHHRPGLEKILFDLCQNPKLSSVLISDLEEYFPDVQTISPVPSSWASSEKDLLDGLPYKLWKDPSNVIHRWKWQLTNLALREMEKSRMKVGEKDRRWRKSRAQIDQALNSCHFWWASPYGWWSLEMVEAGSYQVLSAIRSLPLIKKSAKDRAKYLYEKIVFKAFDWQRSGYIRSLFKERESWRRIPFKDRSEASQFALVLSVLEKEERSAAKRGEYEQAAKWRDGRFKLENGLDVYDAMHIVDQLRAEGRLGNFSKLTKKYKDRYRLLVPGQAL